MKKNKDDKNFGRNLGFVAVPFILLVAPICGYFIGNWLDKYFETSPYLTFTFIFLGIVAGVREFYRMFVSISKDDGDDNPPSV